MNAVLIIPALNEAPCIADVLAETRKFFSGPIYVVDNGSSDETATLAAAGGANVVSEPRHGYGRACRAGIAAASECDAYVFMDGDGSDRPSNIPTLLALLAGGADLALGVRRGDSVEARSILPSARFGNWLSGRLIGLAWGQAVHDLSPLKAIRATALQRLHMREET